MLVTVRDACALQDRALEIHVGDQVEQLDQLIAEAGDGADFFEKTHITGGMETLLREAIARLAGRSSTGIFHLKQAMGGGKTHLLVGLGLTARWPALRKRVCGAYPHSEAFGAAQVAAFNGRNFPTHFFWGEIALQLGRGAFFRRFWESGPRIPGESDWLELFDTDAPVLILLDEMPPHFHALDTQAVGNGTVADIATAAFANLLTAAGKKSNVCVVVSDLTAAYEGGQKRISHALSNARQELGRQERAITPVDLSGAEIYAILRKRLFKALPSKTMVDEIASEYGRLLEEATRAKVAGRGAEAIAAEIAATYPFHPRLKNVIALFRENEQFRQTRGVLELMSRLLKSVWNRPTNDVFLLGPQHFDLGIADVRDALAGIADMREVVARDLWDASASAHAQVADLARSSDATAQVGSLLLTASLSTAVNAIRGLTREAMVEILVAPNRRPSEFIEAHELLIATAWYLHRSQDGQWYFDRQENLTKLLHKLATDAPPNQIEELQRKRLESMFEARRQSVYARVLALPAIDAVGEAIRRERVLLIVSPDSKLPPDSVQRLFAATTQKNNICVLTGDRSQMASFDHAVRELYATMKADARIPKGHAQREELEKRAALAEQNVTSVVLNLFDKVLFPFQSAGKAPELKAKPLDATRDMSLPFDGQAQIEKTLAAAPQKYFGDVGHLTYGVLKEKAESLLWPVGTPEARWSDVEENARSQAGFPWLPPGGLTTLKAQACARGEWADLGTGYVTRSPAPPKTSVQVIQESGPNDQGEVRLRITPLSGGPAPRIHFALSGQVDLESPVLHDDVLVTKALRASFLCVDPSGANTTGDPTIWTGRLVLRCERLEGHVRLLVSPVTDAAILFTTDHSDPRYGTRYAEPIPIPPGPAGLVVDAFSEHEGIEVRQTFRFPGGGTVDPPTDGPASIHAKGAPKRLDSRAKVNLALARAHEIGATFDEVQWTLGAGTRIASFLVGEVTLDAQALEAILAASLSHLPSHAFPPDAPLSMTFRRAHFRSGLDLAQFAARFGLTIGPGEIVAR